MVVGWYHSHPGFGCWLSGVDINTQQSFEALSERAVAVVVDPIQSVKGKVRYKLVCWLALSNVYCSAPSERFTLLQIIPRFTVLNHSPLQSSFFSVSELKCSINTILSSQGARLPPRLCQLLRLSLNTPAPQTHCCLIGWMHVFLKWATRIIGAS